MPLPVLSIAQMREWEKATWATGVVENFVIERVGQEIAERVLQLTKPGAKILLLAGKGHNGDDAQAAVPHLQDREAEVMTVTVPSAIHDLPFATFDLVVDGLFGIGLNRPLDEDWQKLIRAINDSHVPVLAIDVPSGLNADTGEPQGAAIHASVTLTVGAPKAGLLLSHALEYVGRLEVAENVGLTTCAHGSELSWISGRDFKNFPPRRLVTSHKGTFGHLAIIAGSLGYHGAAVLAARGALQAQPGLVTVFTPENVYLPIASQLHSAMVHPWKATQQLPDTTTAILFGPGLAANDLPAGLKEELISLWKDSPLPVIVDASGLDFLPTEPTPKNALRIITPHPGETARMLKTTSAEVQKNRPAALRELSKNFGNCWVVLKGHQTLTGRSAGGVFVNSSGNPFLAQGGSGDILAGYLAGLLAHPSLQAAAAKTICYAVWQHGAAADQLSAKGTWMVEELILALGRA